MLADPRSESMVTNFAAQWLFLRDVAVKDPDIFLFPDHDVSLRAALERETELFVDSVFRSGGSVLELLTAKHTFVNERLAKHYGIPHVQGSYFRRVELGPDSRRSGLLGQGSILTVTSYAARTSPVLRGKYVLDNLLASPPPPPPPDVPSLATEDAADGAPLTLREAMIRHRANPACASCHAKMDPIGFALEHFDAVGRWRDDDAGAPIEAASELPDGSVIDGPEGVQALLTTRPELFVSALTEKLMMYALGRNVQYYDAPAVRAVVRAAAATELRVFGYCRRNRRERAVPDAGRARRDCGSDHGRDGGGAMKFANGHVSPPKGAAAPHVPARHGRERSPCRCSTRWCRHSRPTARRGHRGSASSTSATASCTRPSSCRAPARRSTFSPVLKPLAPLREYLTVVSGLDHAQANNFGDGTGDHPRSSAAWLTGVHAYDRTRPGVEVKLATTADQLAADVLGAADSRALARARRRHRDAERVRLGRLLLRQHGFLAQRDDAEPDREPPARRVRAAVRRRRQRAPSA